MITLITYPGFLFVCLLISAVALTLLARAFGSPRRKLLFGLLATGLIAACNLSFIFLATLVDHFGRKIEPVALIAASCMLLIIELYLIFVILRRTFLLSWQRTLGLFVSSTVVGVAVGLGLAIVVRT